MSKDETIIAWIKEKNLRDEFFEFIQRPDAYTRVVTGLCGWRWEEELELLCKQQGFRWKASSSKCAPYDGEINGMKVQCKATCAVKAFDIRCKKKENNRRYTITDFDVLALKVYGKTGNQIYFVPADVLRADGTNLLLMRIRLDYIVSYLDNWDIFRSKALVKIALNPLDILLAG